MSTYTFSAASLVLASLLTLGAWAQAPAVSTLAPARHATAAPVAGPVTLQFTQAITAASAANLRVYGGQRGGLRTGMVSGGGTTNLRFTPAQSFAPGERVSVSVPATLQNAAGTGAARQVYQFTAATAGDGRGLFLDTTEVAYASSRDLLLGDIDNDGDLDLLANSGLYGMYSFLGNGAGGFTAFRNTIVGTPSGAMLADVNGDGFLDLLAGDIDNATVAIALNNADGTGMFAGLGFSSQLLPVGTRPVSIAVGDVDGDGDLDFVTANSTASTASVALNNGAGVFGAVSSVSVSASPTTVQLADVDNDGDLDLLASCRGLSLVSVRLNNGLGSFSGATNVQVGLGPSDLALADLDSDGDLDLLTCNSTGRNVSVRLNSGTGTFSGTTSLGLPTGSTPNALTTGDVDGDGDLDVTVAQGAGGQLLVLLNSGTGALTLQSTALLLAGPAANTLGVALGDVDGDGDLDVVTCDASRGRVVLGRGVARPVISGFSPASGAPGSSITISGSSLRGVRRIAFAGYDQNVAPAGYVVNAAGTQITGVVVPPGTGSGPITVVTGGGTASSSASFVVDAPQLVVVQGSTPLPAGGAGYSFANQVVSSTSAAQVFTLRNLGALPLTITSATVSGDFVLSSGPGTLTVAPGGSTTVAVAFAPTVEGARSGSLTVLSDAAGFPSYVVALRGMSVPPVPTLTAVLPASAPAGDTIALSGTHLDRASAITFSGSTNNVVTTWDPLESTCRHASLSIL